MQSLREAPSPENLPVRAEYTKHRNEVYYTGKLMLNIQITARLIEDLLVSMKINAVVLTSLSRVNHCPVFQPPPMSCPHCLVCNETPEMTGARIFG
jgi:hypothetical protein